MRKKKVNESDDLNEAEGVPTYTVMKDPDDSHGDTFQGDDAFKQAMENVAERIKKGGDYTGAYIWYEGLQAPQNQGGGDEDEGRSKFALKW
jgi:hypothetical protein